MSAFALTPVADLTGEWSGFGQVLQYYEDDGLICTYYLKNNSVITQNGNKLTIQVNEAETKIEEHHKDWGCSGSAPESYLLTGTLDGSRITVFHGDYGQLTGWYASTGIKLEGKSIDEFTYTYSIQLSPTNFTPPQFGVTEPEPVDDQQRINDLAKKILSLDHKFDREEIERISDELSELDPDNYLVLWYKGFFSKEDGKLDDAFKFFLKMDHLYPDSEFVTHMLGEVTFELGNYDDALRYFDKALALDPHNPITIQWKASTLYEKANELFDSGEYDLALDYLVEGRNLDPQNSEYYNELINAINKKIELKQFEELPDEPKSIKERVPSWIKNNAKWWADGQIGDSDFVGGIQHLLKEKIIDIPDLPEQTSETAKEQVPDWVRNNAGWWADGLISEDDFVSGLKWLVEKGIIRV